MVQVWHCCSDERCCRWLSCINIKFQEKKELLFHCFGYIPKYIISYPVLKTINEPLLRYQLPCLLWIYLIYNLEEYSCVQKISLPKKYLFQTILGINKKVTTSWRKKYKHKIFINFVVFLLMHVLNGFQSILIHHEKCCPGPESFLTISISKWRPNG